MVPHETVSTPLSYLESGVHLPSSVPISETMGKIPGSAHANMTLGGLCIVGGAIGFAKKGSKASLIAGATLGSLLLGSSYLIASTDHIFEGHCLASATTATMALAMGQRFASTGKFMPAGMVATLGILGCAYNMKKTMEWAPTKEKGMYIM